MSITAAAIRKGDGTTIGVSEIVRDIGARKRAERAVRNAMERERQARGEAEAANRAKDDFLVTLSHELRTSLNSILGWVKMLRAGTLDATTAQRALEVIERNAYSQNQLVTDLLDVSRIITGTMTLETAAAELGALIDAALETVRPAAEAKSIVVTKDFADDVLRAVSGTLKSVRVLIIDDDEDTCEMTSSVLKHAGASPLAVTSAQDARRALQTMQPDVIVCDLGMPGETGYDFIRDVRAGSGAQGTVIPAIAMTAYARQEDRRRSFAAGFQTHLPKPVEPIDLVDAVRKLARP